MRWLSLLQQQAAVLNPGALIRAVRAFNSAISESKGGWQPQLPLELALIESTRRNWPFLRDRRIDAYAPLQARSLDEGNEN